MEIVFGDYTSEYSTEDPGVGREGSIQPFGASRPRKSNCTANTTTGLERFDPTSEEITLYSLWDYVFIMYTCRDCQSTNKTFAVLVIRSNAADVEVMKLGEYPPFSAPISSRIQKLLSKADLELYRKGSRAEAQGLGIGAATYFRAHSRGAMAVPRDRNP